MQEVFEKIIDAIEKERGCYFLTIANTGDKSLDVAYEKVGEAIEKTIEIVKQEAEKYNNVMIDGKYCFQTCACTEKCDKCSRLCNGDMDWYENIDNWAEEFATDTNVGSNGWIPCSERLPDEGRGVILYVENKAHKGSHVVFMANIHNAEWQMWETSRQTEINYTPIAWHPLPDPYQPKGE